MGVSRSWCVRCTSIGCEANRDQMATGNYKNRFRSSLLSSFATPSTLHSRLHAMVWQSPTGTTTTTPCILLGGCERHSDLLKSL